MGRHLFSLLAALTVFVGVSTNLIPGVELEAEERENMEDMIDVEEQYFVMGEDFDENENEGEAARQNPVSGCDISRTIKFTAPGQSKWICDGSPWYYDKPSYKKFIIRFLTGDILIECPKMRIRTSPGCRRDKLSLFSGVGFNTGTRFCGRFNNFERVFEKRVKVVFKAKAYGRTNIGFACNVTAVV